MPFVARYDGIIALYFTVEENERHFFGNEVGSRVAYLANSETIVADDCSQIVHFGQSHLLKITENHLHSLPSPFLLCGCLPAVCTPTPTYGFFKRS